MLYLDAAVLDLTERWCQRLQLVTGRPNVWLAVQLTNLSIVVYFVWAASLYAASGDLTLRVFVALFCASVFVVLTRTIFKVSIETTEADAYRRVARGVRNPRRLRDAQLRISFLTLSVFLSTPLVVAYVRFHLAIALLTGSLIALTTVLLYVLACDPLPPCPGKLRAWMASLASLRAAASRRENA